MQRWNINGVVRRVVVHAIWGQRVDAQNSYGATPMIFAILRGHHGIFEILSHAGADLNLASHESFEYRTPLMFACHRGKLELAKSLLKKFKHS